MTRVRPLLPGAGMLTVPTLSPAELTACAANDEAARRSMSMITCVLGGTNSRTAVDGSASASVPAGNVPTLAA